MRRIVLFFLLVFSGKAAFALPWHTFDSALAEARKQDKPVLLLQMFGRLDERWC